MSHANKTLFVTYYLESGCLGAQGADKINDFCQFLSTQLNQTHNEFCSWQAEPQLDIHQHHFKYTLMNKTLSAEQAKRYLNALQQDHDTFENTIDDHVIDLIERYLGR